jgi:anti-sigma factor RsiW
MTCPEVRDLLSAHMDTALPAGDAHQVSAHIESCPVCREELAALRLVSDLVGSLPAGRLRTDLAPRVVARASAPRWRETWAAMREFVLPRRAFLGREMARAAAIAALFFVAASGPKTAGLVVSWPGRVAAAAQGGMVYVTSGIAQAQALLSRPAPSAAPGNHDLPAPHKSGWLLRAGLT